MYKIKAVNGKVNVDFNISELISNANKNANSRLKHNAEMRSRLCELATSYLTKLNNEMDKIGVEAKFKFVDEPHNFSDTLFLRLGHGLALIEVRFILEGNCTNSFLTFREEQKFSVLENWRDLPYGERTSSHKIESVADIINKSENVIKYFLIEENVSDFNERKNLINSL